MNERISSEILTTISVGSDKKGELFIRVRRDLIPTGSILEEVVKITTKEGKSMLFTMKFGYYEKGVTEEYKLYKPICLYISRLNAQNTFIWAFSNVLRAGLEYVLENKNMYQEVVEKRGDIHEMNMSISKAIDIIHLLSNSNDGVIIH